ncbi:MAG: hypothetical protein V1897_12370 [Pseudomonadota bacterium]
MTSEGFFTESDRFIVSRASLLAESLVLRYFDLATDEWIKNPYSVFTWKETAPWLRDTNVLAQTVRIGSRKNANNVKASKETLCYGVLLQDPAILRALLRPHKHDLWTLGLFVLTHELVHIVRFRRFDVDFFGSQEDRENEENLVHTVTSEILRGVENTDNLLNLYESGLKF